MSGQRKEDAKESLYKALGRRVVWKGKLNTFLRLNPPSALDVGQSLSGVEISPRKRGQPKSLEQVLLLKVSGRSLSRFLLCQWKGPACPSIPKPMTVLWATWLQKSSVLGSSRRVFFLHGGISVMGWVGWEDLSSVPLFLYPLLSSSSVFFFFTL